LRQVDPQAYLAQTEEVLGEKARSSEGESHPEVVIRAFALRAWQLGQDEERVRELVEGLQEVPTLDLLQQQSMVEATQALLGVILRPTWMRTDATLLHARRFFPDVVFAGAPASFALPGKSDSIAEYLAYLLLDFGMADAEIEDVSLAFVAHLGRDLGIQSALSKVVRKELRMSAAKYAELEKRGAELAKRIDEPTLEPVGAVS
jgi:hypothetical protein